MDSDFDLSEVAVQTENESEFNLEQFQQRLNELPDNYRFVLLTSYFEGKSQEEISKEMGVALSSCSSQSTFANSAAIFGGNEVMASFDSPHAEHQPNPHDLLTRALYEVAVSEDFEERILANLSLHRRGDVTVDAEAKPFAVFTRDGWMAAAIAASCSGVTIGGGSYS